MYGIKGVAQILEPFGFQPPLSVVQGDGDKGQDGKGLEGHLEETEDQLLALEAEPQNIQDISVTFETSQFEMSPLKIESQNISHISVTLETFQSAILPLN